MNKRIIPILLLNNGSLVKSRNFQRAKYIGDPINTIRIFNELEADEIIILDISSHESNFKINFKILRDIASESFIPMSYGGGINSIQAIHDVLNIGFEKVVLNSSCINNPNLITEAAKIFGSQSIICSIDFKKNLWGNHYSYTNCGRINQRISPLKLALNCQDRGAGEIILTDIDREGGWAGYNIETSEFISSSLDIPLIVNGGAGKAEDILAALNTSISAAAASSIFLYYKKNMGVLVNFPSSLTHLKLSKSQ